MRDGCGNVGAEVLPVGGGGAVLVLSELESMAARQQREIAQQRRLLEQREARLAVLRGAQEPAQQDRLARLRHRLDQQQSKLNRLRLLRSQTDASKASNATLTSDLDCIKALFNEKEKELSLAVAKVDELTQQLEELRGRHNGTTVGTGGHLNPPASAELEKLRRELMYRNKMNEQQNQVVSQQRLALAQRQAEMSSIDARIAQLQVRLQRKRALNQRLSQQIQSKQQQQLQQQQANVNGLTSPGGFVETKSRPAGNIAAIEPYSHIPDDNDFNLNKNDPKYQTLPYNTKFTLNFKPSTTSNNVGAENDVNKNKIQQQQQHSPSSQQQNQQQQQQQQQQQNSPAQKTIAQQLQQFAHHQIAQSQSQAHIQGQPPSLKNSQTQVANQQITQTNNNLVNNNNNNSIANNNNNNNHTTNHNYQLDRSHQHQYLQQKQQQQQQHHVPVAPPLPPTSNHQTQRINHQQQKPVSSVAPSFAVKSPIYQTSSTKIHPVQPQTLQNLIGRNYPLGSTTHVVYQSQQHQPSSPVGYGGNNQALADSCLLKSDQVKFENLAKFQNSQIEQQQQLLAPNKQPPDLLSPSLFKHEIAKFDQTTSSTAVTMTTAAAAASNNLRHSNDPKHDHMVKLEPPSKDKSPEAKSDLDKTKPALPPKPSKPNLPPRLTHHDHNAEICDDKMVNNLGSPRLEKDSEDSPQHVMPPIPTSDPPESPNTEALNHQNSMKTRPMNFIKSPVLEQSKMRYSKSNIHVSINRRIEMPPAFLFPETEIPEDLKQSEQLQQQQQQQLQQQFNNDTTENSICKKLLASQNIADENGSGEKIEDVDIVDALNIINIEDQKFNSESIEIESKNDLHRRKKGNLKSSTGKVNLSRRVSFDPLALLLDASLEGELELVKKTAKEVANPSSANDEGITALHNAICAGHLEIVKFLVEFGCDVNAQDSDGWTPLHCAASCNNLSMVRFLVEHGACIFATTLSDHETAAEKCEEDEEGFDGCSEYLYSVQEKLGIMNNGQVYAVFEYDAQHSDELTLKNGDSLVILRKGDDNEREWWWSKLGHREGYVPRNLLGLYPRVQPVKAD